MRFLVALTFILVFVIAISARTKERSDQLKRYGGECYNATHVDVKLVNAYLQGEWSDDPKLKEFFDCAWLKLGLRPDGTFDKDALALDLAYNSTVRDAALKCTGETGSNPAETVELAYNCIKNHLPAGYDSPW